ncbi:Ubiquitin carboxyl-terminal hydrolase 32 [Strongyloides ratti]|uniref:ubiquitinyl hydrolase 1 n=1 Tax=Strongyloides ratti TaxID=34506 RepID=A0A090L6X6_STRRB|nr:Ubiquitin carboxyl-terminal hydrolase 32 [Strongyloides ratti]CEF65546.1 Ubiquitin carboxyl-terminal hydrolase 32 [Strongyloides ratti]
MDKTIESNHQLNLESVHFSKNEIIHLDNYFKYISTHFDGVIDFRRFVEICVGTLTQRQLKGLFEVFDEDKTGWITFKKFIDGLGYSCRGTYDEKIKFVFKMFGINEGENFDKITFDNICNELSIPNEKRNLVFVDDQISYFNILNWARNLQEFDCFLNVIKQNCFVCLNLPLSSFEEEVILLQRYRITFKRTVNTEVIIISAKWWNDMIEQLLNGSRNIKPINYNEEIIDNDLSKSMEELYNLKTPYGKLLKKGLVESIDYVVLDKYLYFCLERKYGLSGSPIIRYINSNGEVDLYLSMVFLYIKNQIKKNILYGVWAFPKTIPLWHLKLSIQRESEFGKNFEVLFYLLSNEKLIKDTLKSLEDLFGDQNRIQLLINLHYCKYSMSRESEEDSDENSSDNTNVGNILSSNESINNLEISQLNLDSVVGLANIGNSCYMNSVLQCLIRTTSISVYILRIFNEINNNHFLIYAYGKFLQIVFQKPGIVYFPNELKFAIASKCPAFANCHEQDAGEFLSSFLNILSEEISTLNKENGIEPNISHLTTSPGDLEWKKKLINENSIITEEISGLLKSSLTCESCLYTSDTFEPFTLLQLSIPADNRILVKVIFLPLKDTCATRLCFLVPGKEKFSSIKRLIQERTNVHKNNLFFSFIDSKANLCQDNFRKLNEFKFEDIESILSNSDHNIIAFEIPTLIFNSVLSFAKIRSASANCLHKNNSLVFIGIPFPLHYIPKSTRVSDFYDYVYDRLFNNNEKNSENIINENEEKIYPFTIKMVNVRFQECSWCSVSKDCPGCDIRVCGEFLPSNRIYFAIDWKPEFFTSDFNLEEKFLVANNYKKTPEEIEFYSSITLSACFNAFLKSEILDHELVCNSCFRKVKMKKQFKIERTPNILIINLKRFMIYSTNLSRKLLNGVDFPLTNFSIDEGGCTYECYAIVNHIGDINNGHYIAYAKINGIWYCFDDINVEEVTVDQIDKTNSYILFYRKNLF